MSVNKILSGEYEVMLLDDHGFTQPQTGEFKRILTLARIGEEAEKAIQKCCLYTEDCRIVKDKCFLQEVCKMVREEKE